MSQNRITIGKISTLKFSQGQKVKSEQTQLDFQQKMMRALLDSGYKQANGIIDPYQLLSSFCDSLSKSQSKARKVIQQNIRIKSEINQLDSLHKNLTQQKHELQARLKGLQLQLEKASRNQISKVKVLQERVQQLKALRQKNHAQIEKLTRKNQTAVAEILADNRQRVHDLVARHKYDMMQYRKTVEEDSWKMQSALRGQIDLKNEEIKKLVANFDRLKKSEKVNQKDWIVLQSLMKPYKEHSVLVEKVSQLRKQIASIKADNRNQLNKYLELQIQANSLKNEFQKSKEFQKLLKEKIDVLQQDLQNKNQQLQRQIQDKDRLTKYYDEKWIQQFNQVKNNLEKKFTQKTNNCEREYNEKKKQIQLKNLSITQENNKLKLEVKQVRDRLVQKQKKIEAEVKVRLHLIDKIYQIRSVQRQSQCMFHQDIAGHLTREKQEIQFLQCQIQQIQYKTKQIQQQHKVKIAQKESLFKDTLFQLKKQQYQKRKDLQTELQLMKQVKFQKEVQLKKHQVDQKKLTEKIRLQYEFNLEKKIQFQREKLKQQMEEKINENSESQKKLWIKIRENERYWKQAQSQKQEVKRYYEDRQQQYKKFAELHQKQIEIYKQQLKQITFLKQQHQMQVASWKNKVYDYQVEIKSLSVMLQSKQATIYNLNLQLKEIVKQKNKWGRILKNTKLQFQQGFKSMKENCDKLIAFYKGKIWEMERMLQKNPISQKDYTKIKTLTEQNKKLYNKIQIKEAQNLILHQVKQYYESKVHENQFQKGIQHQKRNVSVFVKRPKKRQGFLSLKQTAAQRSAIFDTKQVSDLRRYIKKKQRQNSSQQNQRTLSLNKQQRISRQRNKSSMA